MPFGRCALPLLVLVATACAMPTESIQDPRGEPAPGRGFRERFVVEPMLIPTAWIWRDVDTGARQPEEEDAVGEGVRAAFGSVDQSIGVLFQNFRSDNDVVDFQTLYLDFDTRLPIEDGGGLLWFRAGAGIGTCWLDTPLEPNEQDLAAQLRVALDVQPIESFAFSLGFGGLVLGHPGDTAAYGTFVTLSAVLTF